MMLSFSLFFFLLMRGGEGFIYLGFGNLPLKRPCLEIATDVRRMGRPRSATAAACSRVNEGEGEGDDNDSNG